MLTLPRAAEPLIAAFAPAFTRPSYLRFVTLLVGAIVTGGRRTVTRILWTVRSRPAQLERQERRRRHKAPSELTRQLVAALMHWFPDRRFILLGDGQFSGIQLADFARRHARRLTLIGRLRADAALYAKPPRRKRRRRGRRANKGRKLRSPGRQIEHAKRRRLTVRWYGNSKRRVHVVSGTGLWYRCGCYASIRWVYVHDPVGHRTDYFSGTDPRMSPRRIIELFR